MEIVKRRDSNMELLRMVAMFLIVILHLDIFLLEESPLFRDQPVSWFFVYFLKSLTIIGVNLFVMLSGWYGITFKWHRFFGLWFQVFFFVLTGLISNYIINGSTINLKVCIYLLFQMDGNPYGFFQSYILLYIFSPVLNQFIKNADKTTITYFLCIFFLIQFIWGCISWGYVYFGNGFSALSYMGLYIFARFARVNQIESKLKGHQWIIMYILISLLSSIIAYHGHHHPYISNIAYSYASPLVIISAFSLLASFSKIKIKSNIVNWIAIHCFAIYLFHMNSYILPQILNLCTILNMHKQIELFLKFAPLICIITFALSILLDKCRLLLWNKCVFIIQKYSNKRQNA